MSLTRKHYRMLAGAIKDFKESSVVSERPHLIRGSAAGFRVEEGHVENLVDRLCLDLKADNPRFNVSTFRAACGLSN